MTASTTRTLIKNVRPWGAETTDVVVADGVVEKVGAERDGEQVSTHVIDGDGRIVLPSFTDAHVHLDSTRVGLPFRPHTGRPGVWGMMMNDRENWRNTETPHRDIVAGTMERMIAAGTTRIRTYAEVDADCKLERLESVLFAKEKFAHHAHTQNIAFPQAGLLRAEGSVEVLEEALKNGADVVGGIDPCQLDRDPARHLDIVFGLAQKYQVGVDVHLHEPGELGVFSAELIFERTRALGMQGNVNLSHSYDLGSVSPAVSARLTDEMAELDIPWISIAPAVNAPQFNLMQLTEAGIRIGLGEDGQRDYWSPYGDCDMLSRTWQLAFTHHLRHDSHIELAAAIATWGGATIIDPSLARLASATDRPGFNAGDPGDFVLLEGETVTSAGPLGERSFIEARSWPPPEKWWL